MQIMQSLRLERSLKWHSQIIVSPMMDFAPRNESKNARTFPIPTAAPAEAIVAAPAPIDLAPSNISRREFARHAFPKLYFPGFFVDSSSPPSFFLGHIERLV